MLEPGARLVLRAVMGRTPARWLLPAGSAAPNLYTHERLLLVDS